MESCLWWGGTTFFVVFFGGGQLRVLGVSLLVCPVPVGGCWLVHYLRSYLVCRMLVCGGWERGGVSFFSEGTFGRVIGVLKGRRCLLIFVEGLFLRKHFGDLFECMALTVFDDCSWSLVSLWDLLLSFGTFLGYVFEIWWGLHANCSRSKNALM